MTITVIQNNAEAVQNVCDISYSDDAATPALATFKLGFSPRYVQWLNSTDRISYEWYRGMPAGTALKSVAAGTRTLDTADVAISVVGTSVTIAAAAILQSKLNYMLAFE